MSNAHWDGPWAEEQRRIQARAADEYEQLYRLFLKGRLNDLSFREHRAYFGVHSRSQAGQVMIRLKTPLGRLSAGHLRSAADLARRFTPTSSFHISIRQSLQFYDVPLEDSPDFLHEAVAGGFGVAGAGGKNPRAVTLPAGTGLGPEDAFDPTWAAHLLALRLESDLALRGLPGKLKIGFWRSLHDEEAEPGNDITIIPVRRMLGTRLRRGFRLLLGGGLGAAPRVEALWKSFVTPQDLYAHLRAVMLHFKVAGSPRRPFNRLRHLVRGEGWPAFQTAVEQLLRQQPRDRAATFHHRLPLTGRYGGLSLPFWVPGQRLVPEQLYGLKAQPLGGTLSSAQSEGLATILPELGDGLLRLSARQQLWFAGMPGKQIEAGYQALRQLGLASAYTGAFSACVGSQVCTQAKGETDNVCRLVLGTLKQALGEDEARATLGLKLGVSGCPNDCGHHKSADLGFEGLRRRLDGEQIPFVRVFAHHPALPRGLALPLASVPQSRLPQLIGRVAEDFKRSQAPDLASFLRQSAGFESLQRHLADLAPLGSRPGEDPLGPEDKIDET